MVGFAIHDSIKYRQVRSPFGGGTRYPRVDKSTNKQELLGIICPLFFPGGQNCHGTAEDFIFDISSDVRGTQLMQHNESVEDIMTRLGLKHFRCYLLAKRQECDSFHSLESLPDLYVQHYSTKEGTSSSPSRSSISVDVVNETSTKSADKGQDIDVRPITYNKTPTSTVTHEGSLYKDEICTSEFSIVTLDVEMNMTQQPDVSFGSILSPEHSGFFTANNEINLDTFNQPVSSEYIADIPFLPEPSSSSTSQLEEIPTECSTGNIQTPAAYDSDDSGVIQFGKIPPDGTELDKTLPLVCKITVHRGLVCRDLINLFSEENHQSNHLTTFEIKMLKEDGSPEVAEDNGGVMRDTLIEFWDTFYLQFTEGNTYKVPVLRHDMTDVQWKAVAAVIRVGFNQEGIYPIKLAPSFMQQAIFGTCNESDLIESFRKYVPNMDKTITENALKDFESVEKDDTNDAMEQYEAKKLINAENVDRIVREIAHKELVQKPMFVADCFYKLLNSTPLVQEDMLGMYSKLKVSPKKVLNCLRFPQQMTPEETTLSLFVKKLVREMDDPTYLELFLRFCTGADVMTKNEIYIRFSSSDASDNVRCPSAHTCGCVLEIPRSYAQDPYVLLKSDFLSLLKNRYWQMDIV